MPSKTRYEPDCSISRRPPAKSTMPTIGSLEAKPSHKPGSVSRHPEPTLTGRGEKRTKP
jgi:hypothetical protein